MTEHNNINISPNTIQINDDIMKELIIYINDNYSKEEMIERVINDYQKKINELLKITPGISTGLMDISDTIKINTYDGNISDIQKQKIDKDVVFDASSMTKMFTIILLLKEEEKGNIDLNRNFSDYSKLFKNIDIPVIELLRFKNELRTDGRLDIKGLTNNEILKRFLNTYIYKKNIYRYSDIPYMLAPLLFGKTEEEATANYLDIFYETYKEMGLTQTGYSTINMTGGIIEDNQVSTIFDPKARIFEKKLGYISGHAGLTTTVQDIEKLFIQLNNGFLNETSLKKILKQEDTFERGAGVYVNKNQKEFGLISKFLSENAFAISGSTGTYAVFDLDSGLMTTYFANIKSTTRKKKFNTGNIYTFGGKKGILPNNFETIVIGGTGTIRDGRIINENGEEISFFRAMDNFKEEQIKTLLKIKAIKKIR